MREADLRRGEGETLTGRQRQSKARGVSRSDRGPAAGAATAAKEGRSGHDATQQSSRRTMLRSGPLVG